MASVSKDAGFIVWGIDQTAYGPVELPALVSWVKDERVTADTWIYAAHNGSWQKATDVPELQMFFRSKGEANASCTSAMTTPRGIDPRALRRIKILSGLTDDQLEHFTQFVEVEEIPQWSVIVKQGDPGDAMYFILEGELRVRISLLDKETILATLGPGEFFGDVSLFDQGPRSADVVANHDSLVVKFPAAAFEKLVKEAPDIATSFLRAVGRTLSARIRTDNKRYGDAIKFTRAAG
jgi:hypothetical protein